MKLKFITENGALNGLCRASPGYWLALQLVHFVQTGELLSAEHTIPFEDWPPPISEAIVTTHRPIATTATAITARL